MREKRPDVSETPDIEITAGVKTRRLRFEKVPETEVRFRGYPDRESVSGTDRENLPDRVERGVTYRDARVRLRIASEIAESAFETGDREPGHGSEDPKQSV
ncbi:MAG TPA: hypothetical protein VFJ72_11305 [Rubrobacteraceae bacterium]|nr:hypothetical protein [Rubrobacteraceae bacterium]